MSSLAFQGFGYPTNKPCDVCGKEGDNQSEPRFGYVVCEEHFTLSPMDVTKYKWQRKKEESEAKQRLDLNGVTIQTSIKMHLTLQQLKNIVKEAENNQKNHYFADDIVTFHVEPHFVKVTQPVRAEFEEAKTVTIFDKPIHSAYVKR